MSRCQPRIDVNSTFIASEPLRIAKVKYETLYAEPNEMKIPRGGYAIRLRANFEQAPNCK